VKSPLESLYQLWSAGVVIPTAVLSTTLFGSTAIAAGLKHPKISTACSHNWARSLLAVNFTKVRVHGVENIDPATSYLVMCNHNSYFDTLALLGALPLPLRFVMKKELGRVPIFGTAVRRWGGILVDRSDRSQAINELKRGIEPIIQNNLSLLVFPEGTRSRDGQLGPFKKGGFVTAIQSRLPILPVAVVGSTDVMPSRGWKLKPGTIDMVVGAPIPTLDASVEKKEELMLTVRDAMLALVAEGKKIRERSSE